MLDNIFMALQANRKTQVWDQQWERVVPSHRLDGPGGDAVSAALNPFRQLQTNDPMVLVQLELDPHIPVFFVHSSMSAKWCYRPEVKVDRASVHVPSQCKTIAGTAHRQKNVLTNTTIWIRCR